MRRTVSEGGCGPYAQKTGALLQTNGHAAWRGWPLDYPQPRPQALWMVLGGVGLGDFRGVGVAESGP